MRGILISLAIIFFIFSMDVLISLNGVVYQDTGQVWIPMWLDEDMIIDSGMGINGIGTGNATIRSGANGNANVKDIANPMQQQEGVTDVMAFFGFAIKSITFLGNSILNATIKFHIWAQNYLFIPEYLALRFSLFLNLAHAFFWIQFLTGKDIRGGG